jgi:hypothetical protein
MKSWVFAALVGAGVVVVSLSGAGAAERKIKVSNGSLQIIKEIYAAPADTGDYRENLLSAAVRLQPNGTATVAFDDGGVCTFDLQAVTGDDDMFTARTVDVCTSGEVKFPQ